MRVRPPRCRHPPSRQQRSEAFFPLINLRLLTKRWNAYRMRSGQRNMAFSLFAVEGAQNEFNPSRILVDTSVILDWLLDRHPFADKALRFWEARDAGRAILYSPASVLTGIFSIARRQVGATEVMESLDQCLAVCEIISMDKTILPRARALPNDFEDTVAIACAEAEQLDVIITCDVKRFQHSPISVLDPTSFHEITACIPSAWSERLQ